MKKRIYIKRELILLTIIFLFFAEITWAWTTDDHEWEEGDSINWDIPYQTQATFRNWTTACMPTSGAMVVNFFYAGAHRSDFNDVNGQQHPWNPIDIDNPYETTGQRIYALGIIGANNTDEEGISLNDYLIEYPKNGLNPPNLNQFYCTDDNGCSNANNGPLHNERWSNISGSTRTSITNTSSGTPGYIDSLINYLSKKHLIEARRLPEETGIDRIESIRNALYEGPVIISVRSNCADGHIVVIKGVTADGNFIVNDPWNGSLCDHPADDGNSAIYAVLNNGQLRAYIDDVHSIRYAYLVPVIQNFERNESPFSSKNIPVEAILTFNYDASGQYNNDYNGDGDYADIRNGFSYWKSDDGEWNYFYDRGMTLGFLHTKTIQGQNESATAQWTPYFTDDGRYQILVGFYIDSENNSSEVNYRIFHTNGQDDVIIDQTTETDVYETRDNIIYKSLGTYCFKRGENINEGSVKLINTSNSVGNINVDVVRFLYIDNTCNDNQENPYNLPITFSEYSLNTEINNQYRNYGIIFGGDSPFISTDDANPTAPVLSGTPKFYGAIEGYFVISGTNTPKNVFSLSFDAGYFDKVGTVRVQYFDKDEKVIGQTIASEIGIQELRFDHGGIARFRIEKIMDEPYGFAIDNLTFKDSSYSILFREKDESEEGSFFGFLQDEIPGFDHVGFNYNGIVYESHPGYKNGIYVSENGDENVNIVSKDGVQNQHTYGTFLYCSQNVGKTKIVRMDEISIQSELAQKMASEVDQKINTGATFNYIAPDNLDFSTVEYLLNPAQQKGGNNTFTCVGLIEWAAEQAGHRNGQGFINDEYESFKLTVPEFEEGGFTPTFITYDLPMLSPMWLRHIMLNGQEEGGISDWLFGMLDPVDFIITDPIDRKLGSANGIVYDEIPGAFYSGDGSLEYIAIPNPLPGTYQIDFIGIGEKAVGGIQVGDENATINQILKVGEKVSKYLTVYADSKHIIYLDVNNDGVLNNYDVSDLRQLKNQFTNGLYQPGDINNNGIYEITDADMLEDIINNSIQKDNMQTDVHKDNVGGPGDDDHTCFISISTNGKNVYLFRRYISLICGGICLYLMYYCKRRRKEK